MSFGIDDCDELVSWVVVGVLVRVRMIWGFGFWVEDELLLADL